MIMKESLTDDHLPGLCIKKGSIRLGELFGTLLTNPEEPPGHL